MTKNTYFSLLTHTKQLLLVKFCDTSAEIRNSKVWWYASRTDRRESWNSYVDCPLWILSSKYISSVSFQTTWNSTIFFMLTIILYCLYLIESIGLLIRNSDLKMLCALKLQIENIWCIGDHKLATLFIIHRFWSLRFHKLFLLPVKCTIFINEIDLSHGNAGPKCHKNCFVWKAAINATNN